MEATLSALRALLETQADEIVALIVEPIVQGAGGIVVMPQGCLREIAALCGLTACSSSPTKWRPASAGRELSSPAISKGIPRSDGLRQRLDWRIPAARRHACDRRSVQCVASRSGARSPRPLRNVDSSFSPPALGNVA